MLTAPRVYFAMAEDRLFFRSVAEVSATHPRAGRRDPAAGRRGRSSSPCPAPTARSSSYVVSVDFIFFGLTGAALFVFRRRDPRRQPVAFQAPGPSRHHRPVRRSPARSIGRRDRLEQPVEQPDRLRDPARGRPGLPLLAAQEPAERGVRTMQSDYMHWAKNQPPVRYPLRPSEVPHFRIDRWPIDPRRPRARRRQPLPRTRRCAPRSPASYGVTPDRSSLADGTSMANMLAMAALIAPGRRGR